VPAPRCALPRIARQRYHQRRRYVNAPQDASVRRCAALDMLLMFAAPMLILMRQLPRRRAAAMHATPLMPAVTPYQIARRYLLLPPSFDAAMSPRFCWRRCHKVAADISPLTMLRAERCRDVFAFRYAMPRI